VQRPFSVPPPPARRWSFSDFEQLLSGRLLAWVGGLAILLGAIFFLGLAFTRGWIGPAGRVGIGVVVGLAFVAGGVWFFERREAIFGHVLLATGLGTTSISLVAATRLYHLFPATLGLAGALALAGVAAMVAIRANSQVVAGYGLVMVLAAPPLLGADANLTTIAFLAVALIGTTAIALYRTWNWLPAIAFLLSAPQLASWIVGSAPLVTGLIALGGFWALNTLAAGGEEFRIPRFRLSVTSTTLLLGTAGALLGTGFALLNRHGAQGAHALFLLGVAVAYGAVGFYFLRLRGLSHPFGLLAAGTGIAALTMAVPIQFGGPVVPIAWAAEAAALAWVCGRLHHRYSGIAAAVLGTLAILHLVTIEYPIWALSGITPMPQYGAVPFLDAAGGTLAYLLLAGAVASLFIRANGVRVTLATIAYGLVLYALAFETQDIGRVIGWSALIVCAFAAARITPIITYRFPSVATAKGDARVATECFYLRVCITAGLAIFYTFVSFFPHVPMPPDIPFTDKATLATGILIAASLLAAALATERLVQRLCLLAPFVFAAGLLPYELHPATTVVGYAALAIGLYALAWLRRADLERYVGAASGLVLLGLIRAFFAVAPPSRLAVHAMTQVHHPFFLSGATAAFGAIIVALVFGAWTYRKAVPWLLAAGAVTVYTLSVGIVDAFQNAVTASTAPATFVGLARQAQVALSITWAVLGGMAFIIGVVRRLTALRLGGLALLGIATVKVFLFDLAWLDATYRVPSLIGLGILLLACSYAYQRLRPRDQATMAS
jgi:hypothetical protein